MILSALGLVTPEFLRSKRRHAIVLITVAASFLTPGDVITLTIMLMVPLFFLYEFSIVLSKMIWKRKKAKEAMEAAGEAPNDSVQATAPPHVPPSAAPETDPDSGPAPPDPEGTQSDSKEGKRKSEDAE
jgi:sec-independent protein translocase protein TatC